MKNYTNNLPESYKEIFKVVIPFIVIVVLFVVVGKFGVSQVIGLRSQISDTQTAQTILTEKLSILQSLSQSSVDNVASVTAALPGTNPSLISIYQLKRIAAKNGINIADIKAGSSAVDTSNLSFVNTSFVATGTKEGVMFFLNDIEVLAPITKIDKVKISETGGIETLTMNTKSYWSPFPKTIPNVTQATSDLSSSEKQTLTQINSLLQPPFTSLLPTSGGNNTTPFGQ